MDGVFSPCLIRFFDISLYPPWLFLLILIPNYWRHRYKGVGATTGSRHGWGKMILTTATVDLLTMVGESLQWYHNFFYTMYFLNTVNYSMNFNLKYSTHVLFQSVVDLFFCPDCYTIRIAALMEVVVMLFVVVEVDLWRVRFWDSLHLVCSAVSVASFFGCSANLQRCFCSG